MDAYVGDGATDAVDGASEAGCNGRDGLSEWVDNVRLQSSGERCDLLESSASCLTMSVGSRSHEVPVQGVGDCAEGGGNSRNDSGECLSTIMYQPCVKNLIVTRAHLGHTADRVRHSAHDARERRRQPTD